MSKEAMTWVIEKAPPFPPHLFATLVGLAWHANKQGMSHPGVPRLAAYACKAERTVRRDLRELVAAGLIRPGDATLVEHLPADRRPEVYELALRRTVPKGRAGGDDLTRTSARTLASGRARGGRKAGRNPSSQNQRPDVDVRGDVDVRADAGVRGDVDVTPQAKPQVSGDATGGRGRPPGRGRHPNHGGGDPTTRARDTETVVPMERQAPADIVAAATDADPDEAAAVVELIRSQHNPSAMRGYLKAMALNGTLPDYLDKIRHQRAQPRISPRDEWMLRR